MRSAEGRRLPKSRHARDTVANVIDIVDLILIMSVNPGSAARNHHRHHRQGAHLRAVAGSRPIDIEINGDGTPETAPAAARAGANAFVAGSAVFKDRHPDSYRANITAIRHAAALSHREAT